MLTLAFTDTTLNIQSLMGIVMLTGMVVSNSILIVDFANRLRAEGRDVREAVADSCRIRLRPILMTSLATVVGLLPMALKLETGSEAYAPLARVIIGGLLVFRGSDDLCGPCSISDDLSASRRCAGAASRSGGAMSGRVRCGSLVVLVFAFAAASRAQMPQTGPPPQPSQTTQSPPPSQVPQGAAGTQPLNLHDAEQIALQNHPQIQAAGNLANAAQAQVTQTKSVYYPLVYGSASGSYAENDTRIGAGALSSPRVFDRYGNGLTAQPTGYRLRPHTPTG